MDNDDDEIGIDATVRRLEHCLVEALSAKKDAAASRSAMITMYMDTAQADTEMAKEAKKIWARNESKHRAALSMLEYLNAEAEETTLAQVHQSEPFQDLAREFTIPKVFHQPTAQQRTGFTKYVAAQERRTSPTAALEAAEKIVRQRYKTTILPKEAATDTRLGGLVEEHKNWLARSDHEPIRAHLKKGGVTLLRVASHNVQERAYSGVQYYACYMPFLVKGEKQSHQTLIQMMLEPTVTREHLRQTVALVERELFVDRTADAVCLQELSPDVAEHLQRIFGCDNVQRRSSWVHVSSSPIRGNGMCSALTAIVSVVPFVPLRDVAVVTPQASKSVVRKYAAVKLLLSNISVVLCSVHVRHAATTNEARNNNKANIDITMDALVDLLEESSITHREEVGSSSGSSKIAGLMTVGDFNGSLRSYAFQQQRTAGLCMLATTPEEPTAYAGSTKRNCIDGAVWISRASDDDDDTTRRAIAASSSSVPQEEW
eukprot:CAMPEP_0194205826 /NCGR_PEP_ID=MMETSP0156-20130528/5022_1 /TAXON_ID=33649 /ORGANISM="Thalassionema nitzschioides, Strain L26-B" /LENGTH=486 /DNA_ID=CAMNT_0038932209 /DNA_START=105 /DNA_END=1562 /DNA_ORIENTATION=+